MIPSFIGGIETLYITPVDENVKFYILIIIIKCIYNTPISLKKLKGADYKRKHANYNQSLIRVIL
jgi:hypothetical protein